MSRPPQVVHAPGPAMAAMVKVPSGLPAASQVAGSTSRPLLSSSLPPYQAVLTFLRWPERSRPVLRWLYSAPAHHFSWKMCLSAISPSVVTPLAVDSGCWYPSSGGHKCFKPFTPWPTQASEPPDTWWQPVLCGEVWLLMSASCTGSATPARK